MSSILLFFLIPIAFAIPCEPHEIYVREQWVKAYVKQNGTNISSHSRKAHCRELLRFNYFQDSTKQTFKGIKTNIKKWNSEEKKVVNEYLEKLPPWLTKYKLTEILRGDVGGNGLNPAAAIPLTKTLIIFDHFFKSSNKQDILNHEISHIAIYDIDPETIATFAKASGWVRNNDGTRTPPLKLLLKDSRNSISEDFANHVEVYYSSKEKLLTFNPLSFLIIEQIIQSKVKNE
jgi:hypothetical protein